MFILEPLLSLSRAGKRSIQLALDLVCVLACFVAAVLVHGHDAGLLSNPLTWALVTTTAVMSLLVFDQLGLYRAVMRYITGAAIRIILTGAIGGAALLLAGSRILGLDMPIGLVVTHAMMVILVVGGVRLWVRSMIRKPALRDCAPVIIYGAGRAGQQLVAALNLGLEYRPVAFVDDDHRLHETTINGVRVHSTAELPQLCERWQIREVLMAMPSLNRQRRRRIVSRLETLGVEVKSIPAMGDLVAGRAQFTDLHPVTPEDMLGRDPVPPKPELMQRNITGKVVLVTGAGGSIGSELCRQIVTAKPEALVLLDLSEYSLYAITTELRDKLGPDGPKLYPVLGSVQNPGRIRTLLRSFKVQTIYHAAAYKHVRMVEENLLEGLNNNVIGTRVIAEAATAMGVESFTLVSTDKTVRPRNVMGASKRLAELICQTEAQKGGTCVFSIVRFGNVLGSSGSVIPRFRDQIERGGPVTVTHRDVSRYFMTICEAAQLVIQAGAMARGGEIFVLDMGAPVKILDLAKSMIRQQGMVPYLLDETGVPEGEVGDIAIRISGLDHGEKLHEELLIVGNPAGTEHPRIMTETAPSTTPEALGILLENLSGAIRQFDFETVRDLLLKAPIDFRPEDDEICDLLWSQTDMHQTLAKRRLRLLSEPTAKAS
ncbi:MAG: polysaccharide biosynthesis protein [Roseinatronobacter sp.]